MEPRRRNRSPSTIERSFAGAVVCCLAAIPLAIGYSFYAYSTSSELTVITLLGGTAAIVIVAGVISGACSVCFGIPMYLLSARLNLSRPAVLLVSATIVGVVVHEAWNGGGLFEDLEGAWLFACFGLYSGAAFWLGADVLAQQFGIRR